MDTSVRLYTLNFDEVRTYMWVALFVVCNMVLPQVFHLIPQGGIIFAPLSLVILAGAYKFGISAESATASFTSWVSTLTDHEPIVVMTHVPIHAHRGDNPGGRRWFEALSHAAETHDVIVFYGHNHTLEEHGDNLDRNSYLLVLGDSISIQGDNIQGVQ